MIRRAKVVPCPRLSDVEAARDDRLDLAARIQLEEHLSTCTACRQEHDLLRALRTNLSGQRSARDELALHAALGRSKEKLFERLDAPRDEVRRRRRSLLAAPVLAAAGLWLVLHVRSEPPVQPTAADISQPAGPAQWDRRTGAGVERIVLGSGTLALHTHGAGGALRVIVPDGEIEDVGTVFRVTVQAGRTVSIDVSEGLVIFHRHDGDDVRLPAGTGWFAPSLPASEWRAVDAGAPAATDPSTLPAVRSSGSHPPKAVAPPPAASTDLAGDEDAAYLRIVALVHEGRREEARSASQAYLRLYPNGFRRIEVERFAH